MIVISQPVYVTAQNPHTGGMKRGYPDLLRTEAHDLIHALTHLPRRLVCESDGQNMIGRHTRPVYQVCHPMC